MRALQVGSRRPERSGSFFLAAIPLLQFRILYWLFTIYGRYIHTLDKIKLLSQSDSDWKVYVYMNTLLQLW